MVNRQDWNLMVIAAGNDCALSPVQLQKALFLLGKTLPFINKHEFYQFKPYNYGPFSQAIYQDAERLSASGLVTIQSKSGQSWSSYRITNAGLSKASELFSTQDKSVETYIRNLMQWILALTFEQLLAHVYAQYPDYAKNSMFKVQP